MRVKEALTIAKSQAGDKAPFDLVHLGIGRISAWSAKGGVQIEVSNCQVDLAVSAINIAKAVQALRDPKISKGSGMSAKVHQGKTKFTVKGRLSKIEPPMAVPAAGPAWTTISSEAVEAIKAAASAIDSKNAHPEILGGLHVGQHWIGAAGLGGAWFVWQGSGQARGVTISPDVVSGLTGECYFAVQDKGIVIKDQLEQIRWGMNRTGVYPTGSLEAVLQDGRDPKGRAVMKIDVKSLAGLMRAAKAAMRAPADVLKMSVNGEEIVITRNQDDGLGFEGSTECELIQAVDKEIGISPPHFLNMLDMCTAAEGQYYMSVGDPNKSIRLWGGTDTLQIEAMISPLYLA